jgi:hypothetical protein
VTHFGQPRRAAPYGRPRPQAQRVARGRTSLGHRPPAAGTHAKAPRESPLPAPRPEASARRACRSCPRYPTSYLLLSAGVSPPSPLAPNRRVSSIKRLSHCAPLARPRRAPLAETVAPPLAPQRRARGSSSCHHRPMAPTLSLGSSTPPYAACGSDRAAPSPERELPGAAAWLCHGAHPSAAPLPQPSPQIGRR